MSANSTTQEKNHLLVDNLPFLNTQELKVSQQRSIQQRG